MITVTNKGSFNNIRKSLNRLNKGDIFNDLDRLARKGVQALDNATPVETGVTGDSWGYKITRTSSKTTIAWTNNHAPNGVNVVILLQYGHGTGTGGYVQGRDFINPAIRPIFDAIAADVWAKVRTV